MPALRTKIPLGDLHAACQSIVTQSVDYVRRGGSIELGYLMYRNQLQGFLLFAAGTAGEPVVKHAQSALDAAYRHFKNRRESGPPHLPRR